MTETIFRARSLTRTYLTGEVAVHALRDVSLDIQAGELVVMLGPSGSGKSTLLNIMGGLDRPTSGQLFFRNTELTALGVQDPPAAYVCVAVLAGPDGTPLAEAEGRLEGVLRWPGRGTGGFGYDPLFHHPASGRRVAELLPEEKNAISHRGAALRRLAEALARA